MFNVWDARTNNTTGPYSEAEAKKLATDLNAFVHANSSLGALFPTATVTGPFYPRKVS